jgi:holo-[acyl-carrier-protein] synthase
MDRERSGVTPAGPEVGIGLCDVDRIARVYGRHGDRFLRSCFSEEEIAYCFSAARPEVHLAGRWAAKRALLSALRRYGWKAADREISVEAGEGGAPRIALSLSHTARTAVAIVILGGSS